MSDLLQQFKDKNTLTTTEILKNIGQTAKSRRKKKKWTIEKLSKYINASETAIKNFEKGQSITTKNMIKILRGLDLLDKLETVFNLQIETSAIKEKLLSPKDIWDKKFNNLT